MPFKYNPPTRTHCPVCEQINERDLNPVIDSHNGKASSASYFPFHNWYYFVLGYSPEYPDYIIKKEKISDKHFVVDPFMGAATTLVCCKNKSIKSGGVEANDFFKFASDVKLNWELDPKKLRHIHKDLLTKIEKRLGKFKWKGKGDQTLITNYKSGEANLEEYAKENRPKLLLPKYMCDQVFVKVDQIKLAIEELKFDSVEEKNLFILALSSILVPVSNIRYGPGFGVGKPKIDADVLLVFNEKVERMISDIESKINSKEIEFETYLGDARCLSQYFKNNSVDFMITSPPYPGDHEYTKHSKIELVFLNMANDLLEFRSIKKRMLRGSTTNIYKDDNDGDHIMHLPDIKAVTYEIEIRLKTDGATSGFEKLYTKLIREYFGGMYLMFKEAYKILKPGGRFALLVSDSHAFKMVHIKTAHLLAQVAKEAGFEKTEIELWQFKNSTSHKYKLLENTLTVQK